MATSVIVSSRHSTFQSLLGIAATHPWPLTLCLTKIFGTVVIFCSRLPLPPVHALLLLVKGIFWPFFFLFPSLTLSSMGEVQYSERRKSVILLGQFLNSHFLFWLILSFMPLWPKVLREGGGEQLTF